MNLTVMVVFGTYSFRAVWIFVAASSSEREATLIFPTKGKSMLPVSSTRYPIRLVEASEYLTSSGKLKISLVWGSVLRILI